jgi:nicotinamidase-related amidase
LVFLQYNETLFNIKEVEKLPDFMSPGSKKREIPEALHPEKGDIILEKPTASIFIGTNFEYMMRNRGIATLKFTGIATEIGIESSARDASNRGFYPVVSDCVASMDKDAHERSLKKLDKIVMVKSSAEILKSSES